MKVIILRGGSGAGKSTWIKKNYPKALTISADKYINDGKPYGLADWSPDKAAAAHKLCAQEFIRLCQDASMHKELLDEHQDVCVIDNTNTAIAEFAGFAWAAQSYGHDVQIVTFVYDPVAAYKRNTHETPLKSCLIQHERLMEQTKFIPRWWKHDYALWDETWPYASNMRDN